MSFSARAFFAIRSTSPSQHTRSRSGLRSARRRRSGPLECTAALEARRLLCSIPIHHEMLEAIPEWSAEIEAASVAERAAGLEGNGPEAINIVWTNRGNITDGFAAAFGTSAEAGRLVVDAAIRHWERVITSWNRADGTTTLQLTVTIDTSSNFGGSAVPARTAPADGKPRTGTINLGDGDTVANPGANDSNGWFFDPTPDDNSEFQGAITNAFAGRDSAGVGPDFYSVVNAEITHVLGLVSDRNDAGGDWNGYLLDFSPNVSATGIQDQLEGDGNGRYYLYDGPGLDHLFTSYNSGDQTAASWGNIVHSAGVGTATISGNVWAGTDDSGNAEGENGRTIPGWVMAKFFQEVYGYSIVEPQQFGSFYAVLNETTNTLAVRGVPNSNDAIYVSVDGSDLLVSVDPPADTPGSYAFRNTGNAPAWASRIPISEVSTINVTGDSGDDDIYIYSIPAGVNLVVDAGAGNDFIQLGNGDLDTQINGTIGTVSGGIGTDSLSYYDLLDVGNDAYTVTTNSINKTGVDTATLSSIESIGVAGNGDNNTFNVVATAAGVNYSFSGFGGDDVFEFGSVGNNLDPIQGNVTVSGGAGADTATFFDANNPVGRNYNYGLTTLGRTGMATASVPLSTETVIVNAGTGNDSIQIGLYDATRTLNVNLGPGADLTQVGSDLDSDLAGTLVLAGGADDDRIILTDTADAGFDDYTLTSTSLTKSPTPIGGSLTFSSQQEILLQLPGGSETVSIAGVASGQSVTVQGNDGNDLVVVASDGDWDSDIFGDVSIAGGNGLDSLTVNDSLDNAPGDDYTLTSTSMVKDVYQDFVRYSGVERVSLAGTSGDDEFAVTGNASNVQVTVNAGGGNDLVTIGSGDIDTQVLGVVSVAGGAGTDTMVFDDTTDGSGSDGYAISAGSFSKTLMTDPIAYSATELHRVLASPNADTIVITSGANYDIRGNGGADAINVQGVLVGNRVTVDGGAGLDDVLVNSDDVGIAAVEFVGSQDLNTLDIGIGGTALVPANGSSVIDLTTLANDGVLQLNDNRLIDRNAVAPALVDYATWLRNGYAAGAWSGAAPSIVSATAASSALRDGVGFATAGAILAASFGGLPVGSNDVLVGYTLMGDATLDRAVNFDDLLRLAANYNTTGGTWSGGNFDYDPAGAANFDDLLILASNYNSTLPGTMALEAPPPPPGVSRDNDPDEDGDGEPSLLA